MMIAPWGHLPGSAMSCHVRLPGVVHEELRLFRRTCETGTLPATPRRLSMKTEYRDFS